MHQSITSCNFNSTFRHILYSPSPSVALKKHDAVTNAVLFIHGRDNTGKCMVSSACNSYYNPNIHLESAHCSYSLNCLSTHNGCLALPRFSRCSNQTDLHHCNSCVLFVCNFMYFFLSFPFYFEFLNEFIFLILKYINEFIFFQ